MKKTAIFVAIAMFLGSVTMNAQETQTPPANPSQPTTTQPATTQPAPAAPTTTQPATSTVTGSAALQAKFLPMPEPLTIEKIFPALGSYQSTQTNIEGATNLTLSLDSANKGLVWIDGLPQGRVKAMLRLSPATYKIPAQKTAEGKSVPEGTLIFDKDANVLNVCLGCKYNDATPAAPFTVATDADVNATADVKTSKKAKSAKPKAKVWTYTGTKVGATTEQAPAAAPQQQ